MAEPAAPVARITRTRAALAETVARWPGSTYETTWALVAVSEIATAPQLQALRRAAKLCDKVAAVVVPAKAGEAAKTLPNLPQTLRAAGADVVWVPGAENALLQVKAHDGADVRVLLQATLAVLPTVIVAPRAEALQVRLWRLLATELGDMFELTLVA